MSDLDAEIAFSTGSVDEDFVRCYAWSQERYSQGKTTGCERSLFECWVFMTMTTF
jgi:hypothetical protein